jgi:methylmalonyl-CoA mutase N-terminal domain/subunit
MTEGGSGAEERAGHFPFTRGIYETMYRGRVWTMRQYAGFGTAEETNERFRYLLDRGQTGLSVAFDLPTQMGYDSDAAMARGEVGRVGVAIDSLDDMRRLFDGIPLGEVSTSMTINSTAGILLALYVALGDERGVPRSELSGTVQNDVLKEYIARGTYIYPVEQSLRLITDLMGFCAREVPRWNTVSISGYHIREAGSTAPQEIAFTFANGLEYVARALDAGLELESFAPRLSFFFASHNDLFEEVAKFRAARRLWATLMRERHGASDRACRLRFHTQTGGSTLTAQQPLNNVVRVAIQALAAVLGGTQSLHTNGYDEALALPTEESAKLALRTQQILGAESGVTDPPDPLGGSFHVEALTDEIEREARSYLERIDEMGGAPRAIEYMQEEIHQAAYQFQKEVESGARPVVGVNVHVEDEGPVRIGQPDYSALESAQQERLVAFRGQRDEGDARDRLAAISRSANTTDNLMPHFVEAVKIGVTLGEISDALRAEWGTHDR